MQNKLSFSFFKFVKDQLYQYKYYYLLGVFFLYFTHQIQSELPFLAASLSELVTGEKKDYHLTTFLLFAAGIIIFRTLSRVLFFYPARIMQRELKNELLLKLQRANPLRYRDVNSGQLFTYLSSDIDQVRALIGFVGLQGGNFLIGMVVLIPKVFRFNAHLVWAFLPMLVSFFIFTFIVSKNKEFFKLTQKAQGEVQNHLIETFAGKKTIKNFHAEDSFVTAFHELSLKELYYFYRSSLGISLTLPLIAFGIGLSLLWGASIIKYYHLGKSALIMFSGFTFLFMEPMSYLTWMGVMATRSLASWKRLGELNTMLETPCEDERLLGEKNQQLSHSFFIPYWDKNLEILLNEKAMTIIVSKTGHGKTYLLTKFAQILKMHNKNVSAIFQDPYIYNDTILNNIFLGKAQDISLDEKEKVKKLLKLMGLDYLDSNLDQLLNLEVGENGKRLSGGQAKRLALIRSFCSSADYILWDDPFSSVDLILERDILTALKNEGYFEKKTILLTGHRLSTVKHCQYVLYIDKDRGLVDHGAVEQLLHPTTELYEYFSKQMV